MKVKQRIRNLDYQVGLLRRLVGGIESELSDLQERIAPPDYEKPSICVPLSFGQMEYIAHNVRHNGPDLTITDVHDGWLFIEQTSCVGEDGSGVWIDPAGKERQGPCG